ncbi:major facilitator superfamily domain-containing protein [Cokeromyces recurvatus]|uniref:major facilitator superfamily domain-containing protein n=1 Tax=Cokeromyces recurvatus TaxID=90255 RepID=UPI002221086F|nr:major facilitator superfamily domain-containing protein [Cokeromyces recurvatus]KAI7900956.1 major facilitator superfamily domain-containing protein [Cokeromyces recurvatus]
MNTSKENNTEYYVTTMGDPITAFTHNNNNSNISLSSSLTEKEAHHPSSAEVTTKPVTDHEYHLKYNDPENGVNDNNHTVIEDNENDISDGGYGWLVILGSFMVQVTSFGVASCWGILQDYLDLNVYRGTVPDSQFQLSFVGTLLEIFVNLMGPVAQLIASQFGSKSVLIIGTILATLGLELASLSSKIWHLYLTQGIMFGAGASLLYVTAMGTAPLWFNKKRGLALGMASSGSGIGGLVLPFIINVLNDKLGIAWTFRILGFICLVCDLIACIFVKDRYPAKLKKGERSLKHVYDISVLKNPNFFIWACGSVISLMGYFIPYFFVPAYATYLELPASSGSILIAIMSAANFIGRILVGYIGDRIGRLNADIIFTICAGLSSLLVWNFANDLGVLIAFSVLFGLFCGSYFAMMTPITAAILTPEQYRTGVSILLLFNIIAIFGITIAGAIEANAHAQPYLAYKLFTGVVYIVGGIILIVLKLKITKGIFAKF